MPNPTPDEAGPAVTDTRTPRCQSQYRIPSGMRLLKCDLAEGHEGSHECTEYLARWHWVDDHAYAPAGPAVEVTGVDREFEDLVDAYRHATETAQSGSNHGQDGATCSACWAVRNARNALSAYVAALRRPTSPPDEPPSDTSDWPQRFAVYAFDIGGYDSLSEEDQYTCRVAAEWARLRVAEVATTPMTDPTPRPPDEPCQVCEGTGNGLVHGVEDWCGACDGSGKNDRLWRAGYRPCDRCDSPTPNNPRQTFILCDECEW